jgi:hypothetical protein
MSTLRFLCPNCRTEFDGRVDMDSVTFEKCQDREIRLKCPECGAQCVLHVSDGRSGGLQAA